MSMKVLTVQRYCKSCGDPKDPGDFTIVRDGVTLRTAMCSDCIKRENVEHNRRRITMTNVWTVERGGYSVERGGYLGYRVLGVFSSEENAELYLSRMDDRERNDSWIEERPLDPLIMELQAGYFWEIEMDYDGTTISLRKTSEFPFPEVTEPELTVWKRTRISRFDNGSVADRVTGYVVAKDEQHAIKIANEFRTRAIAENRMHIREGKLR